MKIKIILLISCLTSTLSAHEGMTPERTVFILIKMSQHLGPNGGMIGNVDYEQIQKNNLLITEDKLHELLRSIDPEKLNLKRVDEPPNEIVVELTQPKYIRFYFKKQKSKEPSPDTPEWHYHWDYILINIVSPVA